MVSLGDCGPARPWLPPRVLEGPRGGSGGLPLTATSSPSGRTASLGLFPQLGLCRTVPGWAFPSPRRGAAAPKDPLHFLGFPAQERKAVGPSDLRGALCVEEAAWPPFPSASGCHPLPRLGPTWLGDQCSPAGRKATRLGFPAWEWAAIDSWASALPRPRSAVPGATQRTRALLGAILLPAASRCGPGTPSPLRLCPHTAPGCPRLPFTRHPGFPLASVLGPQC